MEEIRVETAFSLMKPESCVFVLALHPDGRPTGMAAGWSMKCSNDPAMYCAALWKGGYTHTLIRNNKEFVIAVPNKPLAGVLEYFGSTHGNETDKFRESGVATVPATRVKVPLLADATINLECRLHAEVETGNHYLFIGEVVAAHHNAGKKILLNMRRESGKRVFEEF